MFCMNCGTQLDDGAKFCMNCGRPIAKADSSSSPKSQRNNAESTFATDEIHVIRSSSGDRSEVFVSCSGPRSSAMRRAEEILRSNNFTQVDYYGETAWTKGTKGLTCAQYIKLYMGSSTIGVQAWIVDGVGSVSFKEQSLKGLRLAVWKKSLLKVVETIQFSL